MALAANDVNAKINEGWEKIKKNAINKLEHYLTTGEAQYLFSKKEWMDYYTTIYNLSTLKQENVQHTLYQRYSDTINKYLTANVLPELTKLVQESSSNEEELLQKLQQKWTNHGIMVRWMQRFFQYLDRFYIEINSLTPLTDQGFKIFKTVVFQPLLNNITQAVLSAIDRERNEELVDVDLMKKTVEIYIFLSSEKLQQDSSLPRVFLQDRILEQSRTFYKQQSQSLLVSASLSEYLKKANQFLKEEESRIDRYLSWDDIKNGILKEFKTEMLFNHEQTLLERETGIKYLLKHDLVDDLGLLYSLYLDEQEKYLQPIAQAFRDHIFEQGSQLVSRVDFSQEEHKEHTKIKEILSQTQLIEQVVGMLEKFQTMVRTCFKGNSYFERQRQAAFEAFLSKEGAMEKDKVSMSEILAIYTDIILRKGGMKNLQEGFQQEEYLKQIVQLFTHLVDKDLFIEVYRSYLAKRILNEKSQSMELEKSMISFIKMSCGPQFTKKLEGMMNDLSLAQDEAKKYEQSLQQTQLAGSGIIGNIDFQVTILTTSYWPTYKTHTELVVPKDLESGMRQFSQFYSQKYNHRLLNWCYSLGTATVNAKFPQANRSYDCVVGTFQMCIMMLFNNASNSQLTVKQIKELMKMDDDTCAKNLKTLMFKNYKLLEVRGIAESSMGGKMTPGMSGLQLRDESVIGINESFSSPLNRIVFPTPVIEEVYKKEIVQEDRSIAIEAAIVRIMKSRKKLDHLSLVQEVMQSLRMFRPNPQQIKAKLESLIDKEYLELDKDDKNIYRYLA